MTETVHKQRFLSEDEVAILLRRSKASIKRLRLSGKLSYMPGRPVRIDQADVEKWIAATKVPAKLPPPEKTPEQIAADARAFVLRMKLKPPRKRRTAPGT